MRDESAVLSPMNPNIVSRRQFIHLGTLGLTAASAAQAAEAKEGPVLQPFLTPDAEFNDVSRGNPKPHTLKGAAQIAARLTPETWRCEITADPFVEEPHTKAPGNVGETADA